MSPSSIIEKTFTVTSADTNFKAELKTSSLLNMLIQVAWEHADQLGYGKDFMRRNVCVWVLSRLQVFVLDYPEWTDTVSISSWPKEINRIFYPRDFIITNGKNSEIARASAEWLIIDLKSRRPKLYDPDNHIFASNKKKHAIRKPIPVLPKTENPGTSMNRIVRFSDLDLNQHLTATRYIDWMLDCFDQDFMHENYCSGFIVNFIQEIPFGTLVRVSKTNLTSDHIYSFEYSSTNSEMIYFKGQICFEKR